MCDFDCIVLVTDSESSGSDYSEACESESSEKGKRYLGL
jgi:hypothetical protein